MTAERLKELADFDIKMTAWGTLCGIDEVGNGALAGPMAACAMILKGPDGLEGVDDCKKLSKEQRIVAYKKILPQILEAQITFVPSVMIDKMGIERACIWARDNAILALQQRPIRYLMDGAETMPSTVRLEFLPQADGKSLTVAAASIFAKVQRDRLMKNLGASYPYYGWAENKGYGTEKHILAMKEHGLSPYHRRSFKIPGDAKLDKIRSHESQSYEDKRAPAINSIRSTMRRQNA